MAKLNRQLRKATIHIKIESIRKKIYSSVKTNK